jgi:hypothetical protein
MRCDNKIQNYKMGYSAAYPIGAERDFFSWRFLEVKVNSGIGIFEVKVRGKGEQWNWRFKVSGFDRINGIYRIG